MKSMPVAGEGEVLKNPEGDDSWLVTMAESGDASLDPDVVMDWATECCCE
jgi:hypothetical protein